MTKFIDLSGKAPALALGGALASGWYFSADAIFAGTAVEGLSVAGAILLAGITPMWLSQRAVDHKASAKNLFLSQRLMALDHHVLVNVVDNKNIITEVNDHMLDVTGYSREELVGQPVVNLYRNDEGRALAGQIRHDLMRGQTWQGETPLRCADGSVMTTHTTIIPLFDEKGHWSGSIAARTDITEMTKLMAEHETVEALDELRDDIWILNADTLQFTYMNKVGLRRMGWQASGHANKSMADVAGVDTLMDACQALRKNGQKITHLETVLNDTPFHVTIKFLRVGNQADRFLFLLNDISERLMEERVKSDFVSMVSHELRSPLTSIKGSMGLLLSKATGELPDKAQALLEIAHRNADRLVLIINDILDLEKISSGRMDLEKSQIDLGDLIRESYQANEMLHQRFGVTVEMLGTEEPIPMYSDPNRLIQVLNNLISNACKFSPNGGTVTINVVEDEDQVRVEVKDQGQGIPAEDHDKIFQRFADLSNSDRASKGGTGLGLSICRAIVEGLEGSIGFDTTEGVGTTFFFVLPKNQEPSGAKHEVSQLRHAS